MMLHGWLPRRRAVERGSETDELIATVAAAEEQVTSAGQRLRTRTAVLNQVADEFIAKQESEMDDVARRRR